MLKFYSISSTNSIQPEKYSNQERKKKETPSSQDLQDWPPALIKKSYLVINLLLSTESETQLPSAVFSSPLPQPVLLPRSQEAPDDPHPLPPPRLFLRHPRRRWWDATRKMVARAQGTSLIFHFVAYRYRGAAAARQRRRTRPASGHRYPHPLPRAAGTQGGRKGGGEGEKESVEKKGRQIYIYVYIERRRGGGAASPERGRGALYYIERRNVAAEIVSSPSPRPSPANKDEVSANIILVTGYLSGRNDDFLVHPSVGCIVEVFWNLAALDASGWIRGIRQWCLSMDSIWIFFLEIF